LPSLAGMMFLLIVALTFSSISFQILVNDLGYPFTFFDAYHSLNLSQIAASLPGKIWGFAGLAGLLYSKGISKKDSTIIIIINMILMLSSCAIVGLMGLAAMFGLEYALLCLIPIAALLVGRDQINAIYLRVFPGSTSLPSRNALVKILIVGLISWVASSGSFAWLVKNSQGGWPISPFLVASAFPAGYIGGFISLITPSGLGVREGIIALVLSPGMDRNEALAVAIAFRVIHSIVLWCNVAVTIFLLSLRQGGFGAKRIKRLK
jgi:hypothetical protein